MSSDIMGGTKNVWVYWRNFSVAPVCSIHRCHYDYYIYGLVHYLTLTVRSLYIGMETHAQKLYVLCGDWTLHLFTQHVIRSYHSCIILVLGLYHNYLSNFLHRYNVIFFYKCTMHLLNKQEIKPHRLTDLQRSCNA